MTEAYFDIERNDNGIERSEALGAQTALMFYLGLVLADQADPLTLTFDLLNGNVELRVPQGGFRIFQPDHTHHFCTTNTHTIRGITFEDRSRLAFAFPLLYPVLPDVVQTLIESYQSLYTQDPSK